MPPQVAPELPTITPCRTSHRPVSAMAYTTSTARPVFASHRLKHNVVFVGKRYLPEKTNPDGATLLFLHCAGSHKEAWEPTIETLFSANAAEAGPSAIREAWSFDMPNHGEAAELNSKLLEQLEHPITVEDYGEALKHFVASDVLKGHKLVAIGHSLGATAIFLATIPDEVPAVSYEAAVMVEPALVEPQCYEEMPYVKEVLTLTAKGVLKRRDTWDTREQAKAYFLKRFPWNGWDERVVDLYVKHGLREVPVPGAPTGAMQVTLCLSKEQESTAYTYIAPHFRIVELFRSGLPPPTLPVHWVTGEVEDIAPDYVHESVRRLREVASSLKVPDAGHFVVQQNPDGLGAALSQIVLGRVTLRASL
ncbi:alpha/beta-hydrolase [Trametes elegans]|nr:alpha/beta-hydrolase [Trametes elegans]